MNRALTALILLVATAGGGCTTAGGSALPERPARINHVVFLKLQDPGDAAEILADSDAMLATIPGVVSYYAGQHLDTGRSTVIDDYDVGLFIGFDTEDDYAAYVTHPSHVGYVEKWKPKLEWLHVYDVLEER